MLNETITFINPARAYSLGFGAVMVVNEGETTEHHGNLYPYEERDGVTEDNIGEVLNDVMKRMRSYVGRDNRGRQMGEDGAMEDKASGFIRIVLNINGTKDNSARSYTQEIPVFDNAGRRVRIPRLFDNLANHARHSFDDVAIERMRQDEEQELPI